MRNYCERLNILDTIEVSAEFRRMGGSPNVQLDVKIKAIDGTEIEYILGLNRHILQFRYFYAIKVNGFNVHWWRTYDKYDGITKEILDAHTILLIRLANEAIIQDMATKNLSRD